MSESNERVGIALHDNAPAFVRRRKLRGDPSAEPAHGRLRLLKGETLFQPPERHEPVKVARHVRRFERQGPPDLIEGAVERAALRQHADHRVRLVIEQDRPIHDTGIRSKLADPERVAEDHDTVVAELILAGRERPSESRFDPEDAKVVCRDACAAQLHWLADARQRGASARLRREEVERRVVALPIEKVERRDRIPFALRRLFHHAHDAVRIRIWEGLQQHTVDEAEYCGVGANADRQRQHCDGRVTGLFRSIRSAYRRSLVNDAMFSLPTREPSCGQTWLVTTARPRRLRRGDGVEGWGCHVAPPPGCLPTGIRIATSWLVQNVCPARNTRDNR